MTTAPVRWSVPELGPSLGRLADPPPGSPSRPLDPALDDIRLRLVTGVFELAGAARSFGASGDADGAVASLGRVAWLALWEQAVAAAAARIAEDTNRELERAAAESRLPARRLRALAITSDDTRAITARLGSGGAPFVAALDALEQASEATSRDRVRGPDGVDAWQGALGAAARRLEGAWLDLEAAARTETARWAAEIALVRAWRRPTWPLRAVTVLVIAAASYLGLVLGGYLPVPRPLGGLAAFWWARL